MTRLSALLIAALSIGGCGTLMPEYDDPSMRHITPGRHEVCMTVEVTPPEQIGPRCNFGLEPQGREILGCTFPGARPHPLLIVPMLADANDWPAQCAWWHEAVHATFGDWHRERDGR